MYAPSEDTFLLADCIEHYNGKQALEIGVGSGLLLHILEKNFVHVTGSDIDLQVLQHCRQHASSEKVLLVYCDAGSAFGSYLPNDHGVNSNNNTPDPTIYGGPKGIETTIHFVNSALPLLAGDGKILIVISSFADTSALDRVVIENNMHKNVVKQKKLFYETLSIVELSL
jgi:release factor glutamine methyltransferase